ncbi:MAG: alpha/beta hydrolase [Actinobacteria bacterium]|nr:alpha/beta hydrolase [Actinomycetota bacterium]
MTAPRHDIPKGGRSGFVDVEGRQVHYLEWGPAAAPAVVCLHGGGQTAYMYEDLGAALGDRYHVLAPDLPGHGDSDPIDESVNRRALAATIPPFLGGFGLQRVALVGASLGGMTSITVGASNPDLAGAIVLIDVGHRLEEEGVRKIIGFMRAHESFASLDEAAAAIGGYLPRRGNVRSESLTRNLRKRDDGRWEWKHSLGQRLRAEGEDSNWRDILVGLDEEAAALRCPVLVLRGAFSDVLSGEGAEEVAALIPGARLETVENAGHLAAGDNPHSTVRLVSAFLDTHRW